MNKIFFIFIMALYLSACNENKDLVNPVSYFDGAEKLILTTEKTNYSWQTSETNLSLIIEGTLKNMSNSTYYSYIGSGYGAPEQDIILFAKYSAGWIEKYNELDKSWIEIDMLGLIIEGSKTIPIQPAKNYKFQAFLTIGKDDIEKGKFRLRIEYHDNLEFKNNEPIYIDYSNLFEIK